MSRFKTILKQVSALGLWLLTIGLAVSDIYFTREIFFGLYARISTDPRPAVLAGNILVMLAAVAVLVFAVWSGEYHRRHVCEHESWDVFAWSLVVLLAIPFLETVVL